jgi:hypothetical protein
LYLNKASPDMWDGVLRTFKDTLDKAETTYLAKAKSTYESSHQPPPIPNMA